MKSLTFLIRFLALQVFISITSFQISISESAKCSFLRHSILLVALLFLSLSDGVIHFSLPAISSYISNPKTDLRNDHSAQIKFKRSIRDLLSTSHDSTGLTLSALSLL